MDRVDRCHECQATIPNGCFTYKNCDHKFCLLCATKFRKDSCICSFENTPTMINDLHSIKQCNIKCYGYKSTIISLKNKVLAIKRREKYGCSKFMQLINKAAKNKLYYQRTLGELNKIFDSVIQENLDLQKKIKDIEYFWLDMLIEENIETKRHYSNQSGLIKIYSDSHVEHIEENKLLTNKISELEQEAVADTMIIKHLRDNCDMLKNDCLTIHNILIRHI